MLDVKNAEWNSAGHVLKKQFELSFFSLPSCRDLPADTRQEDSQRASR